MDSVFVWTVSDVFGLAVAFLLTVIFVLAWASDKLENRKRKQSAESGKGEK